MKGKKRAISRFLELSRLDKVLRAYAPRQLTVFNFHRIKDDGPDARSDFDDETFGPSQSEFRAHLLWLRRNTSLISEDDVLAAVRGQNRLPARSTLITFDDGYADNYRLALPVLRELRVPAIFFIPTQAIEERKLGWWDLIAYLLKRTDRRTIELRGETLPIRPDTAAARLRLLQQMKLRSAQENVGLLAELAEACGVEPPSPERCSQELMTWEQLRETRISGVSIGAHTHSHRVLATLSLAEQREELTRSKAILEAKLGHPVRSLAYPVGGYRHFNLETKAIARECGYEAAFSFQTGTNELPLNDAFDIHRLAAPEDAALYAGSYALPQIFLKRSCDGDAPTAARQG